MAELFAHSLRIKALNFKLAKHTFTGCFQRATFRHMEPVTQEQPGLMPDVAEAQEQKQQRAASYVFTCAWCQGLFMASRSDAETCSDRCRKALKRCKFPRELVAGQVRENICRAHGQRYRELKGPEWMGDAWIAQTHCPECELDRKTRALLSEPDREREFNKRVTAEMKRREKIMQDGADEVLERHSGALREAIMNGGTFTFSEEGLTAYELADVRDKVFEAMYRETVEQLRGMPCQES